MGCFFSYRNLFGCFFFFLCEELLCSHGNKKNQICRKGEYCDTPAGRGKICDRNLLSRKVSVAFESGNIATFSVDEINTAAQEKRDGKPKNNAPKGKNGRENPGKGKNNKKHSGNGNQSK